MKASRRATRKGPEAAARPPAAPARLPAWLPFALAALAVAAVFWAYGPAAHGPFLFDDTALRFALPGFEEPLRAWVAGQRPLLMVTYWLNSRISAEDPYSYHLLNVIFHCLASGMILIIVRRLLATAGAEVSRRNLLAGFAAAIFLLHPIQAESVAYLAGRSEAFSDMLLLAAFAVFLCRPSPAIAWMRVAALVGLFGAAVLSKEQAVVLPALLLLTDFWWNPGFTFEGIRRNWRLYGPLAVGAVYAVYRFRDLIFSTTAPSAGFGLKDLTWYQYFFTECRALFVYPALFLFPANLTADWDFPISKSILDHGAVVGLLALLALVGAAWHYRRRYPLAAYGFLTYLVLMAPTSSIVPIRDPIAERRIYLSMLGLLLIVVDFTGRLKLERKALAAACTVVALVLAAATHSRAAVWSSAVALWQDTAQKSPNKVRVHFQLASSYCGPACGGAPLDVPRCDLAVREYARTAELEKPDYNLLIDWALAYDCAKQPVEALAKLRQAAALEQTAHVYTQIAKVYAEQQRWPEALDALDTAEKLDPNFAVTYFYRGQIHRANNQIPAAVQDYQRALALDPYLDPARQALAEVQVQPRTAP